MTFTARVKYGSHTHTDSTGHTQVSWHAHIDLNRANAGLTMAQTYATALSGAREDGPLTSELTVTATSLDDVRSRAAAALEALTGLEAFSTRYVDLQDFAADPAACEEFKVASEQRQAA